MQTLGGFQFGLLHGRLQPPQASKQAQCRLTAAGASSAGTVGTRVDALCAGTHLASSSASLFLNSARMMMAAVVDRARGLSEPCDLDRSCSRESNVMCMVRERRVKMVSQQIKREISAMLLYDKVLQAAVLPETALGADMYLTAVATISDVEMSKDLSVAKVYVSIFGDEQGQDKAMEQLKNKAGYVRKGLAQRMNLKFTPEVRFIKDEALERGSRVIGILDKLKKERELKEKKGSTHMSEEDEEDNGEYEEEENEDKGEVTRFRRPHDDGEDDDWEDAET